MGLPVITLAGRYGSARSGVSLLSAVGLEELVAQTPQDYVAIAMRLSVDLPRLNRLRVTMRERMRSSPLMDAAGFARSLDGIYRNMWRTWCAQNPTSS